MENNSRSRKSKYRSFQVNIKEEIRDIAKWASFEYEKPLYEIVEIALMSVYGEPYRKYKEKELIKGE